MARPTKYDPMYCEQIVSHMEDGASVTSFAGLPSIYGLYDARGHLRYVGKANDVAARVAQHKRVSCRLATPLYKWIAGGGIAYVAVLEASCPDWKEAERRHIAKARREGAELFNVRDGGNGASASFVVLPPQVARLKAFSRRYSAVMANLGYPNGGHAKTYNAMIADAAKNGTLASLAEHIDRTIPKVLPL